jgi:hypothetical protein
MPRVNIGCALSGVAVYGGSIQTAATEATIPNEPAFDLTIASGASCTWTVAAMGPATSVDDFASGALSPQNAIDWSEHAVATFEAITPTAAFVEQ